MPSSAAIRLQIESSLARKIPSALTPRTKIIRPITDTGIGPLDELLGGGLPIGVLSEFFGPECSGRTSAALSLLAQLTQAGKVCAWLDASNTLDPISAAAVGVDLTRLLWVRCGAGPKHTGKQQHRASMQPARTAENGFHLPESYFAPAPVLRGLHGGGMGQHPRTETHGLSGAVAALLNSGTCAAARSPQEQRQPGGPSQTLSASQSRQGQQQGSRGGNIVAPSPALEKVFGPAPEDAPRPARSSAPVTAASAIEQVIRATDLLLQGGGFSALILDLGSAPPELALRIPLATWHRYRVAAERTQSTIVLLTQASCAKSSAELLLHFASGKDQSTEATVLTGMQHAVEIVRQRFVSSEKVVSLRKPPQRALAATWHSRATWAGRR